MLSLTPTAYEKLQNFEHHLNFEEVNRSPFSPRVIGSGEITVTFTFEDPDLKGIAYKRMAVFDTEEEVTQHLGLYREYHERLHEAGIHTPDFGAVRVNGKNGKPVAYLLQELLQPFSICPRAIRELEGKAAERLFQKVLSLNEMLRQNATEEVALAIDGQLSNFSVANFSAGDSSLPENFTLLYLDTSTPFIRKNGKEQLATPLLTRVLPQPIRWIVDRFVADQIVEKYYEPRSLAVDLIANLYKENLADLVPAFIAAANRFFSVRYPAHSPITAKEVLRYYRDDALTWEVLYRARNLSHWWHTKVLQRPYPHLRIAKVERNML